MTEESENEDFKVYKSNSKSKRPNDDLIESECARFKASGADFGIIALTEIKRWMTITPVIQFAIFIDEKDAKAEMKRWEERKKESLIAIPKQNTQLAPSAPENIISLIETIQEKIPDKFPGRLPTVSVLDPQGGYWTTSQARTISSIKPIFCPTVRFDLDPPELYFALGEDTPIGSVPSIDAASHAYYFAGLEVVGGVLNFPTRVNRREDVDMITDADLPLDDLNVTDFILGQILDENVWSDKNEPFVVSFGTANTTILVRRSEQLQELLQNDFFVRYEQ